MLTIQQNAVRAVAYAMAVKDIRYYLNGMKVETNGIETRMICCDGHRLNACILPKSGEALLDDVMEFIIPDSMVKAMLKAKSGIRGVSPEFTVEFDGVFITVAMPDGSTLRDKAIDGKFPDYNRVIPTEFSGECAQYNPAYLLDAELAAQAWLGRKKASPCFCHNGNNSAGIALDGFIAIVMPRRVDAALDAPDAAFREPLTVATKEEIAA